MYRKPRKQHSQSAQNRKPTQRKNKKMSPTAPQQHENRTTHLQQQQSKQKLRPKKKHRQRLQESSPQRKQTAPDTGTSAQQQKTEAANEPYSTGKSTRHTPNQQKDSRHRLLVNIIYIKTNIEQVEEQTHRTKATYKCLHCTRTPRPTNSKTHNRPPGNTLLRPQATQHTTMVQKRKSPKKQYKNPTPQPGYSLRFFL